MMYIAQCIDLKLHRQPFVGHLEAGLPCGETEQPRCEGYKQGEGED